jgi:flagellar basal-body rod modification protein FlgD
MVDGISQNVGTQQALTAGTKKSAAAQKDQFLKLLTFQLKSQNPMKPYDNQEFAAQLAQFTQLEQLSDIKSLIEEQNKSNNLLSRTMSNSALPGMLGKVAKAYTENFQYDGAKPVQLGITNDAPSIGGKVSIYNSAGAVVRTLDLPSDKLGMGDHTLTWDGKDQKGNELPKGNYSFFSDMVNTDGSTVEGKTFTNGVIEAVRFKTEGTMLVVGGFEVPLENITDIATRN